MDKLNFYVVDKEYVKFLQEKEIEKRGFTRIPNMEYAENRKEKLVCGTVFETISNIKYFVPLTSYNKEKSENILIIIENDSHPVKGSLRFNYMFPVPNEKIIPKIIKDEENSLYKNLLQKEYNFLQKNTARIINKAMETYNKVINKTCSQNILINSCDFLFLEEQYIAYCKLHNLELPGAALKEIAATKEKDIETLIKENKLDYIREVKDNIVEISAKKNKVR